MLSARLVAILHDGNAILCAKSNSEQTVAVPMPERKLDLHLCDV
jgi:hypothetical protein